MGTNRKTISVFVILVILITGAGFWVITGFGPAGPGFKGRCFGRGMPACMQKEIGAFFLWRMDREAGSLGLSDVQQQRYNAFRSQLETFMDRGMEARSSIREQAKSEFRKEVMDISVVALAVKSRIGDVSSGMDRNLELFVEFYNTLDDDQKKQLSDHIREKAQCRRDRWGSSSDQG